MKKLSVHIAESLLTGKVPKPRAKVHPSSRYELVQLISEHIKEIKPHPGQEVDLNWIDISEVDDLGVLFEDTAYIPIINTWKIDHVRDFHGMFAHNKYIVRSPLPRLQKKLLRRECYNSMFYGCTSLVDPPELPATQLTPYCYTGMFWGCSSLVDPPVLPATKLAQGCYASMFNGCRSLKVAPELPATQLAMNCYAAMFNGCRSLEVAPSLPATELVMNCYATMFQGCTSLKVAPELPATELDIDCYCAMFKNCDNLEAKAKVPAEVLISIQYGQNMYRGCSRIKHKKSMSTI